MDIDIVRKKETCMKEIKMVDKLSNNHQYCADKHS